MPQTVTATELVRHFADYVNRVRYLGERFILVRGKQPIAELRPVPGGRTLHELPGLLVALPRLTEDEAAAFAADLDGARNEQADQTIRDPWAS